MRKLLPKSLNNPSGLPAGRQGFTLIELLVVITILAVLAVIGFIAYQGVTARARDARRIQEIDAIQKAMEKNFKPGQGGGYVLLSTADFVNGEIPTDPYVGQSKCGVGAAQICQYCDLTGGAAGNYAACANPVSATRPALGLTYIVCANLETASGKAGATYYCQKNAQ